MEYLSEWCADLPKMWIGKVNRDFDAMEMIWNFLMDQ